MKISNSNIIHQKEYHVACGPSKFKTNNHYYEIVQPDVFPTNWDNALIWASSLIAPEVGYTAYIATITTTEEWNFINQNLDKTKRYWVSNQRSPINNNQWLYSSGPEAGQNVYYSLSGRCMTFCNFMVGKPDLNVNANNMFFETTGVFSNEVFTGVVANLFLIEYGPSSELYIPSTPTSGGPITINGLTNYNIQSITASMKLLNPPSSPVLQLSIISTTSDSITLLIPPGEGAYNFTISDQTKSFSNQNYKYQSPYIQSLYPGVSSSITVVGSNFGSLTNFQLQLGSSSSVCTNPTFITLHTEFVCTLSGSSPQLLPVQFRQSNGGERSISYQATVYDKNTMRMISVNPSSNTFQQGYNLIYTFGSEYNIDSYTPFIGLPGSLDQLTLTTSRIPLNTICSTYHVSMIGDGTSVKMYNNGGPFDNTTIVNSSRICDINKSVYCPGPPVNSFPSSLSMKTGQLYNFNYVTSQYGTTTSNNVGSFCNLIYFGKDPTISNTNIRLFNTSGGILTIDMPKGTGFRFTKRVLNVNNGQTLTNIIQSPTSLNVTIPVGSGSPKSTVLSIENIQLTAPSFGYIPPFITSISSDVGTSGGSVIVDGYNLGADETDVAVIFGIKNCQPIAIVIPHYRISCTISAGVGANYAAQVYVGGQIQSNNIYFSYASPVITSITSFENILIVTGYNFGQDVSQSGMAVPQTLSTTSLATISNNDGLQQINITLPVVFRNGPIIIQVGGTTSQPYDHLFKPFLQSIEPVLPASGGLVTLKGRYLNNLRTNASSTNPVIRIGNQECSDPTFGADQYNTFITCTLSEGTGANLEVQVTIDGIPSNIIYFSYQSPVVSNFYQSQLVATIAGSDFGSNSSVITVEFNGNGNQVTVDSINHLRNSIVITIPLDCLNGILIVNVNGQLSPPFPFTLAPVIQSVSQLPTYGANITIGGYFFNSVNYNGDTLSLNVTLDEFYNCENPAISTGSNNEIICLAPPGTGKGHTLEVTIGEASDDYTIAYQPPWIATTNVLNATHIEIIGLNFGSNISLISVLVPTEKGVLNVVNPDSLTGDPQAQYLVYSVPSNALNGLLSVDVDSQLSNDLPVVILPWIESSSLVPTAGGNITLNGQHFTSVRFDNTSTVIKVDVEGQLCLDPYVISFSQLVCWAPAGTGVSTQINAEIDGTLSNYWDYAYIPPTIDWFEQNNLMITINGTNLGSMSSFSWFQIGSLQSTALTANDTFIIAPIPAFSKSGQLYVDINGQPSNNLSISLIPVLNSISSVETVGGLITISGYYLNNAHQDGTPSSISVTFPSNQSCENPTILQDDQHYSYLECMAPSGIGKNIPVTVNIDGKQSEILFSYGAPVIQNVTISTSNYITITGKNFGTDSNLINITLGNVNDYISQFTLVNSTHIEFQALSSSLNGLVQVVVDERRSNGIQVSLFPIITAVSSSDTQGTTITITGLYLNGISSSGLPTEFTITISGQACQSIVFANDNTNIYCQSPPGTGKSHIVLVTIDGQLSNSISMNYNPPNITSTYQDLDTLYIHGSNFGNSISEVSISSGYSITSVNHTQIIANLNTNAKNGLITTTVTLQQSNQYQLNIVPVITDVTSTSPYGGELTITGRYLNIKDSQGMNTSISIQINGTLCEFINSPIEGHSLICLIGQASYNHVLLNVTIDNMNGENVYSSKAPFILSSTQTYYLVGSNITVNGNDFFEPLTVLVAGTTTCQSPQLVSPTQLVCFYNSLDQQVNGSSLSVTVIAGSSLLGTNQVFSYIIDTCQDGCKNGGECISGLCHCSKQFSGAMCDIEVVTPILPTTIPTNFTDDGKILTLYYEQEQQIGYRVSISAIREVSADGSNTVKFIRLEDLQWSPSNISNTTNQFIVRSTKSIGSSFEITLDYTLWKDETEIQFVGQNLWNPVNSAKHLVTVSNWTFSNSLNYLQLIYQISYPMNQTYQCESHTLQTPLFINNNTNTLKAFQVESPFAVLVGSFSQRIIVDGVNRLLDIKSLSRGVVGLEPPENYTSLYIGLNIPYHEDNIVIDPNFITYTKPISNIKKDCNPTSISPSRKWVIPVAVVVSVVGAIFIGALVFYIVKKKMNTNSGSLGTKMTIHNTL